MPAFALVPWPSFAVTTFRAAAGWSKIFCDKRADCRLSFGVCSRSQNGLAFTLPSRSLIER